MIGKNLHQLTARERSIAKQLAHGLSNKQIAANLGISPHTVRDSLSSIFRKLDTRNRVDAAVAITKLIEPVRVVPEDDVGTVLKSA